MNRIKLFFQYRKMLRAVRTVPMYDGRGQGTDVMSAPIADASSTRNPR